MKFKAKQTYATSIAVVATAIASAGSVNADIIDLSQAGSQLLDISGVGGFGGAAKVGDYFEQPTGTGVFEPFLTIDANGQTSTGDKNIEQGYNTAGSAGQSNLYLDQHRPEWNTLLTIGDLAEITIGASAYYAFILDANEPGNGNSMISIDNVRIYTSTADNTGSVKNDLSKLEDLGDLRWALNDPTQTGNPADFNIANWVKLDANQENVDQGKSNGGSGKGDMILYVPVDAFAGAQDTDYLWFYNLNGVHYKTDGALGSTSGYEEWRAVRGPQSVPDGGATVALLGLGLASLAAIRRKS